MKYVVKHAFPGHAVGDRLNESDAPANLLRRHCVPVAESQSAAPAPNTGFMPVVPAAPAKATE
jgi:hypothetical protein